jgi:hypothetical protein
MHRAWVFILTEMNSQYSQTFVAEKQHLLKDIAMIRAIIVAY